MFCRICRQTGKRNSFTAGCTNFRKSALTDHAATQDHQGALEVPERRMDKEASEARLLSKQEKAEAVIVKTLHWMVTESIPISKYPSLMRTLKDLAVPSMQDLSCSAASSSSVTANTTGYESRWTANEIMKAMNLVVEEEVCGKLKNADFLSVLVDESTDRCNRKRLGIFLKAVDNSMKTATHFLTNVRVGDGTGLTMWTTVKEELKKRGLETSKIFGLGTDGATAMTGKGKGLTGQMLRENPHIVNVHCIAHKLALCTSQAAHGVPAMDIYVQSLGDLFYYFKNSASRCQAFENVQAILDSPQLRFKEIHEVSWLSFFEALDTVHRNMLPLLTYLEEMEASQRAKDPKAIGLKKKIATVKFLGLTCLLMDVIPVIGALNLFFQAQEVDIALIRVKLDQCIQHLQTLKEGGKHISEFKEMITRTDGKTEFQGHAVADCRQSDITSAVCKFIDNLIDNIQTRFPNTDLLTAFGVLCMRPITFVSDSEIDAWGNEQLAVLLEHYGEERVHKWVSEDKQAHETKSPSLVDKEASNMEWQSLKRNVKAQMFFSRQYQLPVAADC